MDRYILDFTFAFLATLSFAFLFQTPKKIVWLCGIAGAVSWCMYKYMAGLEFHSFVANFTASFVLAIVGGFFAVITKKPIAVFIATGVIPLVPGLKLYDGMCGVILDGHGAGTKLLLSAGTDSIAIALGVMLGASIFNIAVRWQLKKLLQNDPETIM